MSNKFIFNKILMFLTGFIRIKDVAYWFLIALLGFLIGVSDLSVAVNFLPFIIFIATTFTVLSFTFAINNYYDTESDKINPKRVNKNVISTGILSKKNFYFFKYFVCVDFISFILFLQI